MTNNLGKFKDTFYFSVCGQINTEKTLELAIQRADELNIKKLIVASETGLSALKAVDMLRGSEINLVVVTSAAGTKIENSIIGDLRIGIPDKRIWDQLEKNGAKIVRATDPLYNIGAALEHKGVPTLATLVRLSLKMISSGTAVCVTATLMATDNGVLREGEEVVAVAGSWVGLDTALVVRAANSVNFLKVGAMQIREIICKPRNPAYSWPVNQKDWVGDLKPYEAFAE
ncbi:MAG: pyruvate kinase alpha/beta domain-containing protein [Candidatus Bathyarchaeia archaeon]